MAKKGFTRKGKDSWEEDFKKWRAEKYRKLSAGSIKQHVKNVEKFAEYEIEKAEQKIEEEAESHPALTKTLIFLAFAIPIAILLYALYINYLPFGWEKSYTLSIDQDGVISPVSNEIYLINVQGRKLLSLLNGVEGQINLVIEPNVVLKDATVNVEIQGEDVYLGTPLNLNLSDFQWDYEWGFVSQVPSGLVGNAEYSSDEGCVYFNAVNEQIFSLPNSSDMFELTPMSIYVKWRPSETSQILGNYQQLVGHYNWKIYQGEKSVRFQVGRMNDSNGPFYSVSHPITPDFFNKEHELLAVYSPDQTNSKGYIELWIDGNFAQRVLISNDTIYEDYNRDKNLNLGRSTHNYNKYPYFDGCIYNVKITNEAIKQKTLSSTFQYETSPITIPIIGNGNLNSVKVDVSQ